MRHRVYAIVAFLLFCGLSGVPVAKPATPSPQTSIDAIWPLRADGHAFCTAFSINEQKGYWMTAQHCTWEGPGEAYYGTVGPLRQPTTVIYRDPEWDIAVLWSMQRWPAIPLAEQGPEIGEAVISAGFGGDRQHPRPAVHNGQVMHFVFAPWIPPSWVVHIDLDFGDSGSPLLNERGELVGLMWGKFGHIPFALSVPYEAVAAVYRQFEHGSPKP